MTSMRAERSGGARSAARVGAGDTQKKKTDLKKVLPEVWKLIKPRRWLIFGSFLLMIVNRLCSFALPVSSRYLINNVMYKHEMNLLPWIISAVAAATFKIGRAHV